MGRQVGRKRGEVAGGNVFKSQAYALKLATTPCGVGFTEKGIILPAGKLLFFHLLT